MSQDSENSDEEDAASPNEELNKTITEQTKTNDTKNTVVKNKKTPKKEKPTPIVILGSIANHDAFKQKLHQLAPSGFYIKHTRMNTQVIATKEEEKTKIEKHIEENHIEFHSYSNKTDRSHAFIVKGLAGKITAANIAAELQTSYKIKVEKIFAITNRNNENFPFFLVITDNTITLEKLQKNVKILNYTSVTWSRQINNKGTVQCHRCQRWGHATSNCHAKPRCMKCAGDHWTRECQTEPDEGALKCINCDGNHAANSTKCEVYLDRIEYLKSKRAPTTKNKQTKKMEARLDNPEDFPRLKKKTTPAPWAPKEKQPSASGIENNIINTNNNAVIRQCNETNNKFKKLKEEIDELNSLINLDACLQAFADLNSLLRDCKGNEIDKFQTLKTFLENIQVYGI